MAGLLPLHPKQSLDLALRFWSQRQGSFQGGLVGGGRRVGWGGSWVLRNQQAREIWSSNGQVQEKHSWGGAKVFIMLGLLLQTELMDGAAPVPINSSASLPSAPPHSQPPQPQLLLGWGGGSGDDQGKERRSEESRRKGRRRQAGVPEARIRWRHVEDVERRSFLCVFTGSWRTGQPTSCIPLVSSASPASA